MYRPVALIVPTVALPSVIVSTDQVTDVFVAFCTVAVNCDVAPAATIAEVGLSDTLTTGAAVTVTVALALLVVSATLVAITVLVPACDGGVYKPALLIVPAVELGPATTAHVTAVLLLPCTVAANC